MGGGWPKGNQKAKNSAVGRASEGSSGEQRARHGSGGEENLKMSRPRALGGQRGHYEGGRSIWEIQKRGHSHSDIRQMWQFAHTASKEGTELKVPPKIWD